MKTRVPEQLCRDSMLGVLGLVTLGLLAGCGAKEQPTSTPWTCTTDSQCDDLDFCSGVERCAPSMASANEHGCVVGQAPCAASERCSPELGACIRAGCETSDADSDGVASVACGGSDCDDDDPGRFPGNVEVCDAGGRDEDCDPCTVAGPSLIDRDRDVDGYVSSDCRNSTSGASPSCSSEVVSIVGPDGTPWLAGRDCDDTRSGVHPASSEACNGLDDDCDGEVDTGLSLREFFADCDFDGSGTPSVVMQACSVPPTAPPGCPLGRWAAVGNDCDDNDRYVRPGAAERCNGADDDCDRGVDESLARRDYRADCDGDSYAPHDAQPLASCSAPETAPPECPAGRWVVRVGDCNDVNPLVHPNAQERCNGIDDDCDRALAAFEVDADADGYLARCPGLPAALTDCADADPSVSPEALEDDLCDAIDRDCDGAPWPGGRACVVPSRRTVVAGDNYTCALDTTSRVRCWGAIAPPPRNVVFEALVGGGSHACGLTAQGEMQCWGGVGLGEIFPPLGERFADGVAGVSHTCGIRDDGRVLCWGSVRHGQNAAPSVPLVSMVGAGVHSCGLDTAGSIACWGGNDWGESTPPSGTFRSLGAGGLHGCALDTNSQAVCWGDNTHGQSVAVPGRFVALDGSYSGTCGIREDASVTCWGTNYRGELTVPSSQRFAEIATGTNHTCGRTLDDRVLCWGNNDQGQSSVPVL